MINRLANETSPYLRQHADNPVDWYPWGDEALAKAKAENKPIFLSIGYAACHWCHVMAHESFEDEATAALLNRYFVNVKVDREERPDIDAIYMSAVQALTGHGGWPMSVWLTPEGEPFYGGTYYPDTPRHGMPSFSQVIERLGTVWQAQQDEVRNSAANIAKQLDRAFALNNGSPLTLKLFDDGRQELAKLFDQRRGGFGQAPKFPASMTIEWLLRLNLLDGDSFALHMAEHTLTMMANGGMYDQIGGGFARYSVDADWHVPHFEKMLYDNALLARVYLHAWQMTQNPLYRTVCIETLDWVLREMTHEDGGFYSSYDADSEGVEGKFYVWSKAELDSLLGDHAGFIAAYYDVSERGNWEGVNVLRIERELEDVAAQFGLSEDEAIAAIQKAKCTLYGERSKRIWPGLDDKVLTSWNGLMLAAFAEAGVALGRTDYIEAAVKNATFLHKTMRQPNGRLLHAWMAGGDAKLNGYLEDYAYLADGLLALYQATFDEQWYVWAKALADMIVAHFGDPKGGFFDTSDDHEALLFRPKEIQDNATPSGNAMAANVLLTLGLYTGDATYGDTGEEIISGLYNIMAQYPRGFAKWLCGAWLVLSEPKEIAIIGDLADEATQALIDVVRQAFRPNTVLAVGSADSAIPLLQNRAQLDGQPTAYVCQNFACQLPVATADALREQLNSDM